MDFEYNIHDLVGLIQQLEQTETLKYDRDFKALLSCEDPELHQLLYATAHKVTLAHFGRHIYLRGLIEFSNYCKNNCYYCGLRAGNTELKRFRLTKEEIIKSCEYGYQKGARTFVLQSGEDPYFTDDTICDIITSIKTRFSDCAVTLSIGEKTKQSYQRYYDAGADRYLLRQESSHPEYYMQLHPKEMSCQKRLQCLSDLKEIGYQVGAGFMIDSPYQTVQDIIGEMKYIKSINPQMVGIGPFIANSRTPFKNFPDGSADLTLRVISMLRLMLPDAMIPATTALGSISEDCRISAFFAGANVIMPNISPETAKTEYRIYDGKTDTDIDTLKADITEQGFEIVTDRGDHKEFQQQQTTSPIKHTEVME